ncbi:MAG: HlyD family efflux transporter periplasmic adaptor subunit [Candidatus Paceibacterota bacterium]|jgi:HlyD family secretion protein
MKNFLNKIKLYILAHKIISIIVVIIILSLGYWIYDKITSTTGDTRYLTAKVERGAIISSISGSGQVSSSNQVDIKAKVSGDAIYIAVKNGQKVSKGALIAQLDNTDAQKSVRDAELSLQSAKISLDKLKIQNSNDNLNADLDKAYDDGFNVVSDAFLDLPSIVTGLENLLAQNNLSENAARISGKTAQNYRSDAETAYFNAKKAFDSNRIFYRTLNHNSPTEDIDKIINQTYETTKLVADAIKKLRNFVDFLSEDTGRISEFTSYQNTLSTYTNTNNGHLDNLLTTTTNIKNYKDAFPNTSLDLQSAELSIQLKQNALQDAKDKLTDYFIRAPFDGILASVNIKKADSINTSTVVATLITKTQLAEISLNEVDVAKIKIGQKSTLTFDAIPDLSISGVVAEIDTIGTVSQGVVTYIVKISFDTQDERIKSEMSVSASIITDMKQNVLVVPNSAIKSLPANSRVGQVGRNYVESFDTPLALPTDRSIGYISKIKPNKIPVEVGLTNDSDSEIISGIKEGDEIVIRTILPTTATPATTAPSLFGGTGGNRGNTNTRIQPR